MILNNALRCATHLGCPFDIWQQEGHLCSSRMALLNISHILVADVTPDWCVAPIRKKINGVIPTTFVIWIRKTSVYVLKVLVPGLIEGLVGSHVGEHQLAVCEREGEHKAEQDAIRDKENYERHV